MKTLRFLGRDIRLGTIKRGFLFLIPVLVATAQVMSCHNSIELLQSMGIMAEERNGTVTDYYMFCMRGMPVFHFDPVESFSIPIYWFVFQITASYFMSDFCRKCQYSA